ncbi:kinase-interacting family protein-like isoform X1 [Arachis ipaensis]|uniref:kinase-interacting family protein-like isoform X1 n=1 Tax=Arachis ipaensis TaxID=130454 RepID=UPI0007AF55D0|nr:kinase-interacting family protein-like isoform X1 [Arachis ipaensis]
MEGVPSLLDMGKEKVISNGTLLSSSTKGFRDKSIIITNTNIIPSWLFTSISELEERMKVLTMGTAENEDEEVGDTFAERAESYYQKRPQLLALLQDLYNGYVTLSDRYIQTLAKQKQQQNLNHHSRHSSQVSTLDGGGFSDQEESSIGVTSNVDYSDTESAISYQPQSNVVKLKHGNSSMSPILDLDVIVAELVMKNVECDVMVHEVGAMERKYCESSRKNELQKSLLEVLESERLVLLNENASLSYRVNTLVEENKELVSESAFVKRKAGELAKCVLKMREDHRVFMLHRKIEDLQAQIHGLEKRNKEYYERLLKRDNNGVGDDGVCKGNNNNNKNNDVGGNGISLEVRVLRRFKWKDVGSVSSSSSSSTGSVSGRSFDDLKKNKNKKGTSLWKKLKNMDLILCGMNPTCA